MTDIPMPTAPADNTMVPTPNNIPYVLDTSKGTTAPGQKSTQANRNQGINIPGVAGQENQNNEAKEPPSLLKPLLAIGGAFLAWQFLT